VSIGRTMLGRMRVGRTFGLVLVRRYSTESATHHKIVVIGGGAGGLAIASQLSRASQKGLIIDPSKYHYYQPAWTLVGGGLYSKDATRRELAPLAPSSFPVLNDEVVELNPDNNYVVTKGNKKITYDFLVVTPGIQINWDSVEGLKDALGKDGVATNYSFDQVQNTDKFIKEFKGGNAIFTQPGTPIKCAGAPQKIMYLAEEQWKEKGIKDKTAVKFYSGMGTIFGVKKYAASLTDICKARDIQTNFQHNLVAIRPATKEAVFKTADGKEVVEKYDFIHVTPPMGPPSFIKKSPLADKTAGWVDVNKETMQHVKYPNVFAVGDCTNAPKSRTAAAVSQEAPVAARNLLLAMEGKPLANKYTGYGACPLVTGKNKAILAEFDYNQTPTETFGKFIDQGKEQSSMYYLKRYLLPTLYWNGLLKGRWNTFAKYD